MTFGSLVVSSDDIELNDPCLDLKCTSGKECVIDQDTNQPKCECIKECGYEENPRRRVRFLKV